MKYSRAIEIALLCIILLMTCGGWYIISNSMQQLKQDVCTIKQGTSKKQQSLPLQQAQPQARMQRLSIVPGIHSGQLKSIIKATLSYFSVPESQLADWTRLLLLTAVAESDKGRLLKQVKGPAKGLMMIEPETERDTLNWLKACRPELYTKIKDIRIPAKLDVHECEYNLAYNFALSYSVYLMRKVNPIDKTAKQLAELYKAKYNTIYGKATVNGVLKKINVMNIKI